MKIVNDHHGYKNVVKSNRGATKRIMSKKQIGFISTKIDNDFYAMRRSFEKSVIEWGLSRSDGNKTKAAKLLGLERSVLLEIIKRLSEPPRLTGRRTV